jgi:hypothetical protein
VAWEEALILAPETSLVQIAYLTASGIREPADDLPAWVVAGIRAGRRPPPRLAERAAQRRRAAPPSTRPESSPPAAPAAPDRRDIETAPDLRDAERESWLRRYDAAPPDEQPEVVHEFWTWWGEREQARKLAPNEPPPPPAAHAPNLNQFWQAALGTLQTQTSRQEFDTWLRGTVLIALEGGTATVRAASHAHQEGLEGRYQVPIRRALGDVVGRPVTVRIVVLQAAAAAN